MNPIGGFILAVLIAVVLFSPRRWALLGMMAGVLYLTQGQQLSVLGFNLFAVRFLELAAFVRVMGRREFSFTGLNAIDLALLWVHGYTTIVFLLRSSEGQANMIGIGFDAWLCYFAFRGLIVDVEDLRWFLRSFVLLLAPFVLLVLAEKLTRNNPFAFMGGVDYDWLRGGRRRCQGSFRHPALLGTLGASFLPLYIGLSFAKAGRSFAWIGIFLCLGIVGASNSGGPASAVAIGLVGWLLWTIRTRMRLVRWGMVSLVALAALVMNAPVWYLLMRVSFITGGDGWHRSYLIDVAFQHLDQWWFAGLPLKETNDWFPYALASTGGADITNQFISFGLNAGLGAIALFILLLTRAFSSLGKSLGAVRGNAHAFRESEFLLWGLGVMLSAHVVTWLGITYFDQTFVIWFMQLAAISSISDTCSKAVPLGSEDSAWAHPATMEPGISQPEMEFAREGARGA